MHTASSLHGPHRYRIRKLSDVRPSCSSEALHTSAASPHIHNKNEPPTRSAYPRKGMRAVFFLTYQQFLQTHESFVVARWLQGNNNQMQRFTISRRNEKESANGTSIAPNKRPPSSCSCTDKVNTRKVDLDNNETNASHGTRQHTSTRSFHNIQELGVVWRHSIHPGWRLHSRHEHPDPTTTVDGSLKSPTSGVPLRQCIGCVRVGFRQSIVAALSPMCRDDLGSEHQPSSFHAATPKSATIPSCPYVLHPHDQTHTPAPISVFM